MTRFKFKFFCGSILLFVMALHASASGQGIVSITTEPAGPGSDLINLTSVTIDRPSGPQTISVDDLIGFDILGYDNAIETIPFEGAILGTPDLPAGPSISNRAALLDEDTAINTGINNPSEDEGLLLSFDAPIVNGAGADLVIFEYGAPEGAPIPSDPSGQTLAPAGDPFALAGVLFGVDGSPVDDERVATFDSSDYSLVLDGGFASNIFFFNPAAGTDFSDLATLENGGLDIITPPGATPPTSFSLSLFGAAVDLSDLGFGLGEEVDTLRLLGVGPTFAIDPSFIGGLQPESVPEPNSMVLVAATSIIALLRRRR